METKTRQDSVFEQFNKFMQYWNSGQKASLNIECDNGEAVMNMSVSLRSSRRTRYSPSKIKRNKLRAEIYRKKKELERRTCEEQFDVDDENDLEINSDFNGNDELNSVTENVFSSKSDENKECSSMNNFLDSNYQLCFVDEDDCDSCDSRAVNFLETDVSMSDRDQIESDTIMTPENCSVDKCTVGPTVHCHHDDVDEDKDIVDNEEGEEQDHEIEINSDDIGGNDLIFIVFCENYVSELRTGRISLSIRGYKKEDRDNSEDRKRKSGEDFIRAPSGSLKNFFALHSENCVFKEYFGFEEGGGYDADLSWIDYEDLHLYSKEVHNHINYDIKCGYCIVNVEI